MKNIVSPETIFKSLKNLRPLSQSAVLLTALMQDQNYTVEEVVKIIERDPALSAGVLRYVNSAAFSRKYEIDSVRRSVPLIGEKLLVGMAVGLCTADLLADPLDGYQGEPTSMWRHGIYTATAAREVSFLSKLPLKADLAFTGGIMHDLGKIVLSSFLKGHASEGLLSIESGDIEDYLQAEKDLLGTDHGEIGGMLAQQWKLPASIEEVMRFHHTPALSSEEYRHLCYAVHIGDFIAMMLGNGTGADTFKYKLDSSYTSYFDISKRQLERVVANVEMECEKTLNILLGFEN